MPKAIKKKVIKKTGLKEEEVKSRALDTISLLKEKKKILIYVLSALGLAIILAVILILYPSFTKKKAYVFEREAYNYYYNVNLKNPMTAEERWKKSLELFQKANEIKSTPTAQFYVGNCYFNLGDYDNAINQYLKFIDKYKNEQEILPLVYQKLASAYIKKGGDDKVIKTLDTLAQFKNGVFKDTALSLEAQYYETTGKHGDAVKRYKELVRDFPLSPLGIEAKTKIEMESKKSVEPAKTTTEGQSQK